MARIKILDISEDPKIKTAEMEKILGGTFYFTRMAYIRANMTRAAHEVWMNHIDNFK